MSRNSGGAGDVLLAAGIGALAFAGLNWLLSPSKPPPANRHRTRRMSDQEVDQIVMTAYRRAANLFRGPTPPLYQDARAENAASDGYSVFYNRTWFRDLIEGLCNHQLCSSAIAAGIMAHELAHHFHGDARNQLIHNWRVKHQMELEADRVAGRALFALGLPVTDFERALRQFGRYDNATHPGAARRVAALRRGYHEAMAA